MPIIAAMVMRTLITNSQECAWANAAWGAAGLVRNRRQWRFARFLGFTAGPLGPPRPCGPVMPGGQDPPSPRLRITGGGVDRAL